MHATPIDVVGAPGDVVRVASETLAGVLAVGARTRWKVVQVVLRDVRSHTIPERKRKRGAMSETCGLRAHVKTGVRLITRRARVNRASGTKV